MRDVWMVTETAWVGDHWVDEPRMVSVFASEALAQAHAADVEAQNPVTDWVDGEQVWVDCDVERVVLQGKGV